MRFLVIFLLFVAAANGGDEGDQNNPKPATAASATSSGSEGDQANPQPAAAGGTHDENAEKMKGDVSKDSKDDIEKKHGFKYETYNPICMGKTSLVQIYTYGDGNFKMKEENNTNIVECIVGVDIRSAKNEHLARFVHETLIMKCGSSCKLVEGTTTLSTQFATEIMQPGFSALANTEDYKKKIVAFDNEIRKTSKYTLRDTVINRMKELENTKNRNLIVKAAALVAAAQQEVVNAQNKSNPGQAKETQQNSIGTATTQTDKNSVNPSTPKI